MSDPSPLGSARALAEQIANTLAAHNYSPADIAESVALSVLARDAEISRLTAEHARLKAREQRLRAALKDARNALAYQGKHWPIDMSAEFAAIDAALQEQP